MNIGGILINKEIPTALLDSAQETAKRLGTDDEALRFIVVCDLDANSHYGTSLLCVTNKRSFVLDEAGGQLAVLPHADVAEAKVRRMYGNARLVAKTEDGDTTELTRFTYAVASLCDMAFCSRGRKFSHSFREVSWNSSIIKRSKRLPTFS